MAIQLPLKIRKDYGSSPPGVGDVTIGELVVNVTTGKLYTKRLNSSGEPTIVEIAGGGGADEIPWDFVTNKPPFIAAGNTTEEARSAIGLGSASTKNASEFATAEEGSFAASAIQPGAGLEVLDPTAAETLSEKVSDAALDGKLYGRKNGVWTEINLEDGWEITDLKVIGSKISTPYPHGLSVGDIVTFQDLVIPYTEFNGISLPVEYVIDNYSFLTVADFGVTFEVLDYGSIASPSLPDPGTMRISRVDKILEHLPILVVVDTETDIQADDTIYFDQSILGSTELIGKSGVVSLIGSFSSTGLDGKRMLVDVELASISPWVSGGRISTNPGGINWGQIHGDILNQTDLVTALIEFSKSDSQISMLAQVAQTNATNGAGNAFPSIVDGMATVGSPLPTAQEGETRNYIVDGNSNCYAVASYYGGDLNDPVHFFWNVIAYARPGQEVKVLEDGKTYRWTSGGSWEEITPGDNNVAEVVPFSGTSKIFTTADRNIYHRFTDTAAKTATFDSSENFASGMEFHLTNRATSGDLTISGTGVTLNAPKGGTLVLEPKDTVTVKFISPTEADVIGSVEAGEVANLPTDDDFDNVSALLHFNGSQGSTTITDSSKLGQVITTSGSIFIDQTQSVFGGASLRCGAGRATIPSIGLGSSDYTIEFRIHINALPTAQVGVMGFANGNNWFIGLGTAGNLFLSEGNITYPANNLSVGVWYHIAFVRLGGVLYTYLNGIKQPQTGTSTRSLPSTPIFIGAYDTSTNRLDGWIDELRITPKIARYTKNFTVPNKEYPNAAP